MGSQTKHNTRAKTQGSTDTGTMTGHTRPNTIHNQTVDSKQHREIRITHQKYRQQETKPHENQRIKSNTKQNITCRATRTMTWLLWGPESRRQEAEPHGGLYVFDPVGLDGSRAAATFIKHSAQIFVLHFKDRTFWSATLKCFSSI